ncbi:CLUMA_CG010756, isoform A [Clunio marinus]|uniref:CLUMA_CG010756, isoform A n=1 Tax=Clunio marinus TaxID=568069 RepID=A0A1J1IAP7_9DIPT|nr:CLUMA_CG010756, isoform A [Clunio marinus]
MSFRSTQVLKWDKFNMKELEDRIRKARMEKKIFVVFSGYEKIRESLLKRGWLEKIPDHRLYLISPTSEKFALGMLMKTTPFNFIWQRKTRPLKNVKDLNPCTNSIVRQRYMDFTTKDGINNCADNFKWNFIEGHTDLTYQRSHILSDKAMREEFSKDFRRTTLTNYILFLDCFMFIDNEIDFFFTISRKGISVDSIDFALKKVEDLIAEDKKVDYDDDHEKILLKFTKHEMELLDEIRQIINGTKRFKLLSHFDYSILRLQIDECALKILSHWPYLKYDGFKNVWIVKLIGSSSGYNVTVMNNEDKILKATENISHRYIVQKYVERPLIIHKRKFDIRVYVMTFIRNGFVDIWLYKDCYAKFCTKPFSLDNLDKSVHVSNYAVQKQFMNQQDSVPNAKENMWSLSQLIEYFTSTGHQYIWDEVIYPGIKKNLLAVIIASLEATELEVNNFELNGADFMIAYDYQPVLIEINSVPALYFSRTVVEMITNKLLEDVVKVVVDYRDDRKASTGDFELIHTHKIPQIQNFTPDLSINSVRLNHHIERTKSWKEKIISDISEDRNVVDVN